MDRVVIDSNVLVSGLILSHGYPYQVVKSWEDGHISLVTSDILIDEVYKVLHYPKVKKKYGLDEVKIRHVILNLFRYSVVIDQPPAVDCIKDDRQDNHVIVAAMAGKAAYIVSGDSHLLNLGVYQGIEILKPKDFCKLLRLR